MQIWTISTIFEGKIFQIPNNKGEFSWKRKQCQNFVKDIDDIVNQNILSYFMGPLVIFQKVDRPTKKYDTKKLEVFDLIDGYQRLVCCLIYLSLIIENLIKLENLDFLNESQFYLISKNKKQLKVEFVDVLFYNELSKNLIVKDKISNSNQRKIFDVYHLLHQHLVKQLKKRKESKEEYLIDLYFTIIQRLKFAPYIKESERELQKTLKYF